MSHKTSPLNQLKMRQRDLWMVTSIVILALGAGFAVLWPSERNLAIKTWGHEVPQRIQQGLLLSLITFLVIYLWLKGAALARTMRRLVEQSGKTHGLQIRFGTLRSLIETATRLTVDQDSNEGLAFILEEVTRALHGDKAVLYRVRQDDRIERDIVYPSTTKAPLASILALEDEIAAIVTRSGQPMYLTAEQDPAELGIQAPRPRKGVSSVAAAPLVLKGQVVGTLLVRNPSGVLEEELDEDGFDLLGVFAGFAANLLQNLRLFQEVAQRNAELDRTYKVLSSHQEELIEIEASSILGRISCSMAHALSGPMMSLQGYSDVLSKEMPSSPSARAARGGMKAEVIKLRDRLQSLIDYTATYRTRYELADLNAMLQSCVDYRGEALRERNIHVHFVPHSDLPLTMVDPMRVQQTFLSFLEFIEESLSRQRDNRELTLKVLPYSGRIRIQLSFRSHDQILQTIEPLLNPNVELGPLQREYGLGLAIASNTIRNHQGEVSAEHNADGVTTLTLEFPIRRDAPPTPRSTFPVAPGFDRETASMEEVIDQILSVGEPRIAANESEPPAAENPAGIAGSKPMGKPAPAPNSPDAGINDLFGPTDLWANNNLVDAAPSIPKPPPKREKRTSAPLLDESEVDQALKLFDE